MKVWLVPSAAGPQVSGAANNAAYQLETLVNHRVGILSNQGIPMLEVGSDGEPDGCDGCDDFELPQKKTED